MQSRDLVKAHRLFFSAKLYDHQGPIARVGSHQPPPPPLHGRRCKTPSTGEGYIEMPCKKKNNNKRKQYKVPAIKAATLPTIAVKHCCFLVSHHFLHYVSKGGGFTSSSIHFNFTSSVHVKLIRLTRALLGGGGRLNAPTLRFFEDSEKTAARSAAGFSPTLPPIFSATFVKISSQCHVSSGHQVRSSDPTTK